MFEASVFWLRVSSCFYAAGLLHSIFVLVRHKQSVFRAALAAFRIAVVLHAVAITDLYMSAGRIPVANYAQTLSLCALLIALVFLLVEWRYRFSSMSVVLFPLIFFMTLTAAMEHPAQIESMRGFWLVVHIL